MNPIVYHIAGGGVFFTSVAMICLAAVLMLSQRNWLRRIALLLLLLGCIGVCISSTPVPIWILVFLGLGTCLWLAMLRHEKWRGWLTLSVVLAWLGAGAWEATHWLTPQLQPVSQREIAIVGDSVTAGMGLPKEVTWPKLFAEQYNIKVDDQSGSGFTAAKALARAEHEGIDSPLVLVEIGGNDMLGGRLSAEFGRDLDALLALLTQGNRQVVMLELPLIPFYGNYGRVQRSLARKHGVVLVPKRVFLDVIAPKENTRDTIHLTNRGHQAMADAMWRVLGSAYAAASTHDTNSSP